MLESPARLQFPTLAVDPQTSVPLDEAKDEVQKIIAGRNVLNLLQPRLYEQKRFADFSITPLPSPTR